MFLCLCFVFGGVQITNRTTIFCASTCKASCLFVGGLDIINKIFVWLVLTGTLVLEYGSYGTYPNNSNTIKYKSKCLKRLKIHGYYPESFLLSYHATWKV